MIGGLFPHQVSLWHEVCSLQLTRELWGTAATCFVSVSSMAQQASSHDKGGHFDELCVLGQPQSNLTLTKLLINEQHILPCQSWQSFQGW